MRTLDEVIELSENILMFAYLPKDDTTSTAGLALYYLRKYQWQMTNPDGDHQQLLKCQALLGDFYSNDPLTWDELREMEGKPVWVEMSVPGYKPWSGWEIIDYVEDKYMTTHRDDYAMDKMGIEWQAYRKER